VARNFIELCFLCIIPWPSTSYLEIKRICLVKNVARKQDCFKAAHSRWRFSIEKEKIIKDIAKELGIVGDELTRDYALQPFDMINHYKLLGTRLVN